MKTTTSTQVVRVRNEQRTAVRLAIGQWEEESFALDLQKPEPLPSRLDLEWDSIEAIGAADDASRFRIDVSREELAEIYP